MRFATGLPVKPDEFGPYRPEIIRKKEPYMPPQKPVRDRNEHYLRNGGQDLARASQLEHARRQGERPEDA